MPTLIRLWQQLERDPFESTVKRTWRERLGDDYPAALPFLIPLGKANTWRCPDCLDLHRIRPAKGGGYIAHPKDEGCSPIMLKKADIILHAVALKKITERLAAMLPIDPHIEAISGVVKTWRLGTARPRPAVAVPVFLALPVSHPQFVDIASALLLANDGPFALITPTLRYVSHQTENRIVRAKAVLFTLANIITLDDASSWCCAVSAADLAGFPTENAPPAPYSLYQKSGGGWVSVFDGSPDIAMPAIYGTRFLEYLFYHPNTVIHALELEQTVIAEKAAIRERKPRELRADPQALREIGTRIRQLRGEAERLREKGGRVDAQECEDEADQLVAELDKLKKPTLDDGERARNNVRKAIGSVTSHLTRSDGYARALADHIRRCVDLGYEIQYHPPAGVEWR